MTNSTMHQAFLAHANRKRQEVAALKLKFEAALAEAQRAEMFARFHAAAITEKAA